MNRKERTYIAAGVVIGAMIGTIIMYSIFYVGLIYGITNIPFNIDTLNFAVDVSFNETEIIQAMIPYLNETV